VLDFARSVRRRLRRFVVGRVCRRHGWRGQHR
jgi:uncharacterized protein with PIN domain